MFAGHGFFAEQGARVTIGFSTARGEGVLSGFKVA
jgi:hypothetical protein